MIERLRITGEETRLWLLAKLTLFSSIYGLVLINYIDVLPRNWAPGYHGWLIAMYFVPFITFSILHPEDWEITISLGLYASLMNDLFYAIWAYFLRGIDLCRYYYLYLVPQDVFLGWEVDLGFVRIPVYSWLMALSIYARIVVVYLLLLKWWRERR